jgi:hypothetical protein
MIRSTSPAAGDPVKTLRETRLQRQNSQSPSLGLRRRWDESPSLGCESLIGFYNLRNGNRRKFIPLRSLHERA